LTDYFDAVQARNRLTATLRSFHEKFDLLLTPTMPTTAFPLGEASPIGEFGGEWDNFSPFTYPFNLSGQPAISMPCGLAEDGLPAGLQIIGRPFDDVSVLRAAAAFADARPAHTIFPGQSSLGN
ncbi:MAG: amidase, partial [Alphaproteobacteria bacterium]|nr:amidase [Alphaproteobacteria bacterium]